MLVLFEKTKMDENEVLVNDYKKSIRSYLSGRGHFSPEPLIRAT